VPPHAHPGGELRSATARAIGFLAHAMRDANDYERRARDEIESAFAEAVGPFVANVFAQPVLLAPGPLRVGGFFQLVDEAVNAAGTAVLLGIRTGVASSDLRSLAQAMLLRDVGVVALAPTLRQKPGPLTPDEWNLMHQHPARATALLETLGWGDPLMRQVIRHHHDRLDGSGYPVPMTGDEDLAAELSHLVAIASVADVFTALTSPRPYRRSQDAATVASELRRVAGVSLDNEIVDHLLGAWRPVDTNAGQGTGARPDRDDQSQALARPPASSTANRFGRPTRRFAWADRRL
jgi:hypothetical protein